MGGKMKFGSKMKFGKMSSSFLIGVVFIIILWLVASGFIYKWYKKHPMGPKAASPK